MKRFKYIVIERGDVIGGIAFSPVFQHKDVAAAMHAKVLSAGFLRCAGGSVFCYGGSDSLGISSLAQDAQFFTHLVKD